MAVNGLKLLPVTSRLEFFSFVFSFCRDRFFSSNKVSKDFALSGSALAASVLENSRDFKILTKKKQKFALKQQIFINAIRSAYSVDIF